MATEPETFTLRNGSQEVKPLVLGVYRALSGLLAGNPISFHGIVALCRDPQHKPWGNTGDDLKALGLADEQDGEWHVHGAIRNIVLSAVEGEGLDMTLVNPVKPEAKR